MIFLWVKKSVGCTEDASHEFEFDDGFILSQFKGHWTMPLSITDGWQPWQLIPEHHNIMIQAAKHQKVLFRVAVGEQLLLLFVKNANGKKYVAGQCTNITSPCPFNIFLLNQLS